MPTLRKITNRRMRKTGQRYDPLRDTRSRKQSNPAARLEGERALVIRRMDALRAQMREAPDTTIEEVDPALAERHRDWALLEWQHARLGAIERALCAAQDGRYTNCEECGMPIGVARLKIVPETRLCVHCKRQQEKKCVRRRVLIGG